jgi:type I restriction enzyme S subunit
MNEWNTYRVKDVAKFISEKANDCSLPYIALDNIVSWDGYYIPSDSTSDGNSNVCKKGDVLFGKLRPYLAKGYIPTQDSICSPEFIVLRPNDLINNSFLLYYLLSSSFISYIRNQVAGVKMPRTNALQIGRVSFALPPIEEQALIVAYLDKECDKITREIDLLERKVDCYRRLRRSLINRAVTRGLDPNIPLKPSGSDWIGDIPQHWNLKPLRNFITLISPEKKGLNDYLLLSVTRDRGVIVRGERGEDGNNNRIPEDLSNYKVVHKNQFVVNKMKAWMGSYGVSDFDGIVSPAYYICSVHDIYELFFSLAIRCKMYTNFFWKYSKGIRVDQWDMSPLALKEIPFVTPPKNEQKEITEYLDEKCSKIDSIIEKIKLKIERLKELKRSLINEVVTGQRTIK